jgi:hypothetical protein
MVSQSLKGDLMKAHKARNDAKKNFVVVRLTKAGVPNKMADATQRFYYEHEAIEYVSRVRTLNPKQTLRFTLNDTEI